MAVSESFEFPAKDEASWARADNYLSNKSNFHRFRSKFDLRWKLCPCHKSFLNTEQTAKLNRTIKTIRGILELS